jgi:RNA polymerase sigma-70 factor (ECF subfamily)
MADFTFTVTEPSQLEVEIASLDNRDAQRIIYDHHAPKMLSVCRYYIKDIHHAEEVMLNGFLKVFTKLKSFSNVGSFEGWIRKIMVRECISFLRSNQKVEFSIEDLPQQQNTFDYQANIEERLNANNIQELIDTLPEGYKIVFVMYAIEGYKHHEIATLLNITEGTSKSQLFKARKLLQQQLVKLKLAENGTT